MRHDIRIRGDAFALRPAEKADASFIVALRSDPELTRFLHPISPRVEDQEAWLERYFDRPGEYYFIITSATSGAPQGTIGIYDHDPASRSSVWGRWIILPGSLAAAESVLLIYRVAFERLDLDAVRSRTVAGNKRVISFHESCGLVLHARLRDHFSLGGVFHDAVEHRLTRARWPVVEPRLARTAAGAARIVGRGR